ncbi:c-type cytochrome [Bradyrhizobium sp.]|uniref:c-type cytochrome n=1 Tax=Bradyrhizobium sp. TaxID=376 RepID=UPI00260971D7|nr:c-type cytochrome [Bradyrhizobium sp.]
MTRGLAGMIAVLTACATWSIASEAQTRRPPAEKLPVPLGATREQIVLGDRIFHGEAANGKCSECHGWDAKGTGNGNDLTLGLFIWSDGTMPMIKKSILHNMSVAPGMDGDLTPADVDAVAAYVWAISHQNR